MEYKQHFPMLKNMALVVVGTLVLAFGTALFILPFDLVVGGISSIAIILNNLLGVDFLSIDSLITIITWTLFFIGFIFLGKNFAFKTLISTIVYPIGISLFSKLYDPQFLNGIFCIDQSQYSEIAILLAALFGGVLIGAGCALTFLGGGSTGGVDIFAFLIPIKIDIGEHLPGGIRTCSLHKTDAASGEYGPVSAQTFSS